jgi:hypothetical protein
VSTCHAVYISVLMLFVTMPQLIINTYVSLMYELKKNGKVFTSKFVRTGPSSYEKRIYRAAVSQIEKQLYRALPSSHLVRLSATGQIISRRITVNKEY